MSSFREIYIRDRDTYYDYNSGDRISLKKYYFVQAGVALILTIFLNKIDGQFISGISGFYSILTGFSFSILFYIVSGEKTKSLENVSLEQETKVKKVNKLREELFANVSYFSVLSVFIVLISVSYSFKDMFSGQFIAEFLNQISNNLPKIFLTLLELASKIFKYLFFFVFYFLLLNSIYSFFRLVLRINYFFDIKLKMPS